MSLGRGSPSTDDVRIDNLRPLLPPAILMEEGQWDDWLNVREIKGPEAAQMALPLDDGVLKFHPVSTRVNSARDDDPGLIEPVNLTKPEPPAEKPKPKKVAGGGGQMDLF